MKDEIKIKKGDTLITIPKTKKSGLVIRVQAKRECGKGNHSWDGCVCSVCGAERHEYEVVKTEEIPNGGCCWSAQDPCTGPDCGTPCDSYYPGREGKIITTWKCRRCGREKTDG